MLCCGGGEGDVGYGESDKFKVIAAKGWDIEDNAIGEGGFGTVHLCKRSGKQRACKAMRLPTPLDRDDFRNEVKVMKMIKSHHNICHIIDSAEDARYGYLVMQSCTGGELFDRIASKSITEKDAAMAVLDVLSALSFIHRKKILHRDLKPENLLYKDKAPGAPLKLIDFGLALYLPEGIAEEVCGTTSYMAPEVLHGSYNIECDVWSLGVITYFMLSGGLPFPGKNDDEKEERILRSAQTGIALNGRRWADVSDEAKDFVKKLLTSNPRHRLTSTKAMQHPWIAQRAALSDKPLSSDIANSLKRYADAHRFEKAIRHQMATHLTSKELHRLRNMFEKLDKEGTGTVQLSALMETMKNDAEDPHTAETLNSINLSSFDLDGDGEINWQEFVAGAMHDHEVYNEDNLTKVFAKLDVNGDGQLCQREIASMMGNDHEFSREVLQAVVASRGADGSADFTMNIDEFKKLMLKGGKDGEATPASTHARRRHQHAAVSHKKHSDGQEERL